MTLGRTADTLIFAPTYNEGGTIELFLDALLSLNIKADILIVDDGSKDGTRAIIEEKQKSSPQIHLLKRDRKLGIGSAHQLAWLHARRAGYERIVTLDADLSHDPADIPRLLAKLDDDADVVIGSRYLPGGTIDYTGWRLFLSRSANNLARLLLRFPLTEFTTSLRAAKLDRVPEGYVESNSHHGYSFFLSCMTRFARGGLKIKEVPIHFRDRHAGQSKLGRSEIWFGVRSLLRLAIDRQPAKVTPLLPQAECTCSACRRPYKVKTSDGAILCLGCFKRPDEVFTLATGIAGRTANAGWHPVMSTAEGSMFVSPLRKSAPARRSYP